MKTNFLTFSYITLLASLEFRDIPSENQSSAHAQQRDTVPLSPPQLLKLHLGAITSHFGRD